MKSKIYAPSLLFPTQSKAFNDLTNVLQLIIRLSKSKKLGSLRACLKKTSSLQRQAGSWSRCSGLAREEAASARMALCPVTVTASGY